MVRRVTPRGLLTMQMLGGWLDQALVDQRWIIIGSKGPVRAVTGIRDVHVVPADERTRVYSRDSLFLDVGAKDEAEVAAMGIGARRSGRAGFAVHGDERHEQLSRARDGTIASAAAW